MKLRVSSDRGEEGRRYEGEGKEGLPRRKGWEERDANSAADLREDTVSEGFGDAVAGYSTAQS